ncbi:hypothetical protein BSUW23_18530 [Bacillus spizizenii str. W23]|uniref:Uncharacterized protein n=1 Tax=Bacillus spizizenii (strain ATCC 23059 / NRRL B-14472 / W23) TaxID=655816 RepID=E0TVF9_BACSH|nr:hypothetical protein BSUW23_18530 [Bacillus spizizenii str. W23]EFG92383.1 hypothetical protein BSU6633_09816 [Bacillus spizizenii ATCC 6633 = JCM 2499]MBE0171356.1 hypothetical protein [Bacillus spizizenii]QCJ19553.1 hypothetical protein FA024_17405 [Bacillus subtilis]MDR4202688.1 hypothetical protein [Bacillus spizizenii ATCC 6633 = JCM 2499]
MMYETIRVGDSEIKADVEEMRIHHFIFEGFPKLIVQLHCVTLLPSMMKEPTNNPPPRRRVIFNDFAPAICPTTFSVKQASL